MFVVTKLWTDCACPRTRAPIVDRLCLSSHACPYCGQTVLVLARVPLLWTDCACPRTRAPIVDRLCVSSHACPYCGQTVHVLARVPLLWTDCACPRTRAPIALQAESLRALYLRDLAVTGKKTERIPVAARCTAWVYDRSLAGIAGSNPARGMDVCLC